MALTNAGRDFMVGLLVGEVTSPLFDNANAHIGVGDSNTAADPTFTDLQGTNKFRKGMDVGYPIRAANVMTYRSTFAGTEANFAWNEWGVFNAATDGTMLNRLVEYNGTKLDGQTWIFEVELTLVLS